MRHVEKEKILEDKLLELEIRTGKLVSTLTDMISSLQQVFENARILRSLSENDKQNIFVTLLDLEARLHELSQSFLFSSSGTANTVREGLSEAVFCLLQEVYKLQKIIY